jgi:peroxiredoxin Q/BCP
MLRFVLEAHMRQPLRFLPVALAIGLLATPARAQELQVGDAAPDFTLQATDGKTYTLSKELKGKWLVLAWFPKAYTGG